MPTRAEVARVAHAANVRGVHSGTASQQLDDSDEDVQTPRSVHSDSSARSARSSSSWETGSGVGSETSSQHSGSRSGGGSSSGSSTGGSKSHQHAEGGVSVVVFLFLMLVPIIFLVVYQALPLTASALSAAHLADRRGDIDAIIYLGRALQTERRLSTMLMTTAAGSSNETVWRGQLAAQRTLVDQRVLTLTRVQLESDLEFRDTITKQMVNLTDTLTRMRRRIDSREITPPAMRVRLMGIIGATYSTINLIGKDERGIAFRHWLMLFTVMRRIQNTLGALGSVGAALKSREPHDEENYEAMTSLRDALNADILLVQATGQDDQLKEVRGLTHEAGGLAFRGYIETFLTENPALWTFTLEEFMEAGNKIVNTMAGKHEAEVEAQSSELQTIATTEGMKLMGAIIACILATIFVVWLNHREQLRLQRALRNANHLSRAVKRFVPKSQLKSMGVRSITQVQPGQSTEISLVCVFTDVRDFTKLATTMTNTELFDWLQNYVRRMTTVTEHNRGSVSTVLGDGVFSVFNSATDGMRGAIEMQVAMDKSNVEVTADGDERLVIIGCGVHYGTVVAGVFGDKSRLSCVHIALTVNIASRLEALNKTYKTKILASESVVDNINLSIFNVRRLGKVIVSGACEPMQIYDCFDADALPVKNMKLRTKEEFERGVSLTEQGRVQEAADIFDELVHGAKELLLRDGAAEAKGSHTMTPQSGVLQFDKDGSISPSPSTQNVTPDSSFNKQVPNFKLDPAASSSGVFGLDTNALKKDYERGRATAAAATTPPSTARHSAATSGLFVKVPASRRVTERPSPRRRQVSPQSGAQVGTVTSAARKSSGRDVGAGESYGASMLGSSSRLGKRSSSGDLPGQRRFGSDREEPTPLRGGPAIVGSGRMKLVERSGSGNDTGTGSSTSPSTKDPETPGTEMARERAAEEYQQLKQRDMEDAARAGEQRAQRRRQRASGAPPKSILKKTASGNPVVISMGGDHAVRAPSAAAAAASSSSASRQRPAGAVSTPTPTPPRPNHLAPPPRQYQRPPRPSSSSSTSSRPHDPMRRTASAPELIFRSSGSSSPSGSSFTSNSQSSGRDFTVSGSPVSMVSSNGNTPRMPLSRHGTRGYDSFDD